MRIINWAAILTCGTALAACSSTGSFFGADHVQGHTESTGCVSIRSVPNTATPVAIYKGVAECVQQGHDDRAAMLFGLADAYGRFDIARVSDVSAHEVPAILAGTTLETDSAKKKAFTDAFTPYATKGTPQQALLCQQLKAHGYPAYYPDYMIRQGLGAHAETPIAEPLIPGFNPADGWHTVLTTALHCE